MIIKLLDFTRWYRVNNWKMFWHWWENALASLKSYAKLMIKKRGNFMCQQKWLIFILHLFFGKFSPLSDWRRSHCNHIITTYILCIRFNVKYCNSTSDNHTSLETLSIYSIRLVKWEITHVNWFQFNNGGEKTWREAMIVKNFQNFTTTKPFLWYVQLVSVELVRKWYIAHSI